MRGVLLIDALDLECDGRPRIRFERQRADRVHVAHSRIVAEAVTLFEIGGSSIQQRAAAVGGPRDFSLAQRLPELPRAERGPGLETFAWLLGHVVDDAARLTRSVQH